MGGMLKKHSAQSARDKELAEQFGLKMAFEPFGNKFPLNQISQVVMMATYKGEDIDLTPTEAMAEEAQRGLDWRKEHGRGGTEVGVARASQIVNRQELSPRTVRRMVSYFARHEVDKEGEGFSGEDGYPSAGRIAWALWGGEPGKSWANGKDRTMDASTMKTRTCAGR